MRWVPNVLTGLRILLLPVVLVLLPRVHPEAGPWAASRWPVILIFFLLAITDWLDGYLARRLDATSRWGSMADAIADRLALLLPLLFLAVTDPAAFPAVPLWIPLWILGVDAIVALAWLMARARTGVRPPRSHTRVGRVATWLLFVLVLWVLAGLPYSGVVVLAVTGLGLTTASATLYLRRWLPA